MLSWAFRDFNNWKSDTKVLSQANQRLSCDDENSSYNNKQQTEVQVWMRKDVFLTKYSLINYSFMQYHSVLRLFKSFFGAVLLQTIEFMWEQGGEVAGRVKQTLQTRCNAISDFDHECIKMGSYSMANGLPEMGPNFQVLIWADQWHDM